MVQCVSVLYIHKPSMQRIRIVFEIVIQGIILVNNVSSLNIYNLPLPHWNKISRWVRTLTKCPLGSLLWRKGLSVVEAENGLQGLKGGPWVCGGPNGGGPCGGFPGRYILAL